MASVDAAPLERRRIRVEPANGAPKDVPAIHKTWAQQGRPWVDLEPLPDAATASDADLAAWKERAAFVREDLDFLLGLECHRFWSQLVHDEGVQGCLEKALQALPRPHDPFCGAPPDPSAIAVLDGVSKRLFLVFLRLSTHKESRSDYFTPADFGKILYDNFLLDVPRLMDLCVLFRPCAPELVDKMVANVFVCQPKYLDDLAQSLPTMSSAMEAASDRAEAVGQFSSDQDQEQLDELRDLVSYVTDISVSLSALVLTYPKSSEVLLRRNSFETSLAAFYQQVLVALVRLIARQDAAKEGGFLPPEVKEELLSKLQLARRSCVSLLRQMVQVCCLSPALEDDRTGAGEEYLELCATCLSEGAGALLMDYSRAHPVSEDMELLAQSSSGPAMDPTRVRYLLDGVRKLEEESMEGSVRAEARKILAVKETEGASKGEKEKSFPASKAMAAGAQQDDAAVLIVQVKDLLPDLGDGFVEACLEYYDSNPESVINSLLEENLPPHLMEMDRKTTRKRKENKTEEQKEEDASMAKKLQEQQMRSSVFDGDEFDVNSRDSVDLSRVHKGKRSRGPRNAEKVLEDKAELAPLRGRFQELGMVAEIEDADYDDEYDDTYDENAVGEAEPDAKDEMTERRPFVLPRALGGGHVAPARKDKEEEEDEEEEEGAGKSRDTFLRNPEDLRAEAERRRQSQMAHRGGGKRGGGGGQRPGGGGGGGPPNPPQGRNRDVVGKPKGQGQDKQVQINRARKNANKGKSHRAAAERKQGKGMF